YVRLIITTYSRCGSPASKQVNVDAHQTSWHGCGDSHVGRTRRCGRGLRSSEFREPRLTHRGEYSASLVDRYADLAHGRHLDVPRELDTARRVCGGSDLGEPVPRRDLDPRGRVRRRLPIQRDGARLLPPGQRVGRGPGGRVHETFQPAFVSGRPRERDGGGLPGVVPA